MIYLRGINYVFIIEDISPSPFLFDLVSCREGLLWYGLWSRIGISLRDALGVSTSNRQTTFNVAITPDEYNEIKLVFESKQKQLEYAMVKTSEKKRICNSLNLALVNETNQYHVFRNSRTIYEYILSTTECTTVLMYFIGHDCLWNFKANSTLPVKNGNNVHAHGELSVRRVLHGWETNSPSYFRYNCNEQILSINVQTLSTKADDVLTFMSRVRGDLGGEKHIIDDDTFSVGSFVFCT